MWAWSYARKWHRYQIFVICSRGMFIEGRDTEEEAKKYASSKLGTKRTYDDMPDVVTTVLIFHKGRMISGSELPRPTSQPEGK